MATMRFNSHGLTKLLSAAAMTLILVTTFHPLAIADTKGKITDTDLTRILKKRGLISSIDLIKGQIIVNGSAHRIDMQKTQLITVNNQPVDYFSLDKDLLIRFSISVDEKGEEIVSIIQITGPKKRLEALVDQ